MKTHWAFHECSDHLKSELKAYWSKKAPRLERLLQRFPDQLREIWLKTSAFSGPERFRTRAVVRLPSATVVAEEIAESAMESLDKVADCLARRIKRYKGLLCRDWVYRRRNRRREDLRTAGPFWDRDHAEYRREAFFELLKPLLHSLEGHARRELERLQREGKIGSNDVTVMDLTDEVLVRAWKDFDAKPHGFELDMWLMDLLDRIVRRIESEPRKASIYVPLSRVNPPEDEHPYSEFFLDHALVTLADVLPENNGRSHWDALKREEQREVLETTLSHFEPQKRLAFVHHFLEGFDLFEIAMMQQRTEKEVLADIEEARRVVYARIAGAAGIQQEPLEFGEAKRSAGQRA